MFEVSGSDSRGFRARDGVRVVAASLAVAWCGAAGASYVLGQGQPAFNNALVAVITAVGAVVFALLYIYVDLKYAAWLARTSKASALLSRLTPRWAPRSIALFASIMAIFWLPWLIANYPGGAYWDTYYQIHQVFPENHPIAIIPFGDHAQDTTTSAYFCDHHPLFDTLIYGAFAAASQALTGQWNAGTFAFVILQGAATIVALTASLAFLRDKLGAPRALCLAALIYFCIAPFVSTWALTMVKDSLFSLVFIPYFMQLAHACATRGASLARPRAAMLFALLGVLLCLTKKTGMLIVVPTALSALVLLGTCWLKKRERNKLARTHQTCRAASPATDPRPDKTADPSPSLENEPSPARKALPFAAQIVACLLVMRFLLPWVVFPALDVAPGGRQEALGPLLQQTAAFVHDHRNEVSAEEVQAIDGVIPWGRLVDDYNPTCQDDVKYYFRIDASDEAIATYLRAWAAMGARHPETYLAATLAIGGTYLAPVQSLNIRTTTCDTWAGDAHVLFNPPELDWLREGLANLYNGYANLPVVCLPVQTVVWTFWLPALLWLIARRRHPGSGLLFVPGALVLAACVVGPIFDARYCLPLLYTVPLLACFVFRGKPVEATEAAPRATASTASAIEGAHAQARERNAS